MTGDAQDDADRRTRNVLQWDDPVRGDAGEQRTRRFAAEGCACESSGRLHGLEAEARHEQRVPGHTDGPEDVLDQILPSFDERPEGASVGPTVRAQSFGGRLDGRFENGG
jgi:hypothetical protein